MIKAKYIAPADRIGRNTVRISTFDRFFYLTRTEAIVLKMQLEAIIKKIDNERINEESVK